MCESIQMPEAPRYIYLLCSRSSFRSATYKVLFAYDTEEECMTDLFERDINQDGTFFYIKMKINYNSPF